MATFGVTIYTKTEKALEELDTIKNWVLKAVGTSWMIFLIIKGGKICCQCNLIWNCPFCFSMHLKTFTSAEQA